VIEKAPGGTFSEKRKVPINNIAVKKKLFMDTKVKGLRKVG